MNQQFTEIIKDAIINRTMETKDYRCQYCGKEFRKESTLTAHLVNQNVVPNNNMSPGSNQA